VSSFSSVRDRRNTTKNPIGSGAILHDQRWKTATARTFSSSTTTLHGNNHTQNNDRLLVVGSGVAGSAAALVAAETYQIPVTLLFAGNIAHDCNSYWAQGGIIYRNFDPASGDSAESLARDIHRAGAGLCADDAVQKVSEEGPDRVRELLLNPNGPFADVPFDKKPNGELSLCLGR
jgi:L-aspartate oxidase